MCYSKNRLRNVQVAKRYVGWLWSGFVASGQLYMSGQYHGLQARVKVEAPKALCILTLINISNQDSIKYGT